MTDFHIGDAPLKFLTPKKYFNLLYLSFFKVITLERETKDWNKKQMINVLFQAGIYNFIMACLFVLLIRSSVGFHYDLFEIILLIAFGVAFGVAGGVAVGVAFGVAGVAVGVAVGVAFGVTFGVAGGVAGGVAFGVAGGVASILSYLLFLGRLFYYPLYLPALVKKISIKRIPFHWDENIALPVPFLPQMLVKQAQYDQEAATCETLFLIRERPVHRKLAQKGLMLIIVQEMKKFRTLSEIANPQQYICFLPNEEAIEANFLKNYHSSFQTVLILAQNTRIANEEINLANKLRLLKRVSQKINDFQKQMDFTKADFGFHFGQVASKWRNIIEREIASLEQKHGKPLPNLFVTGNPIQPEHQEVFVGRRDIIEQIQTEALREGGPGAILFIGNRRTGKTSTLLNMRSHLRSEIKPVFIDCQSPFISNSNIVDFSGKIAGEIIKATGKKNESPQNCKTLADITRLMEKFQPQIAIQGIYILLCFDEYERLTPQITNGALSGLPDTLRYWIQHLPNFICLFAGGHPLVEISGLDWSDYLINVRTVPISYLDFDSALHLITKPVPEFDLIYEPTEIAPQLVSRLGGQPYLLQVAMFDLTEYLNSKSRKIARLEDIEIAILKMFETAGNYFHHLWNSELNDSEREALHDLAYEKLMVVNLDKTIKSLIRKEILALNNNGGYTFCVPVFREWIIKYV